MKNEDWKNLAAKGPGETAQSKPEEAGVAILWDLSSENDSLSEMGVVIANQTTPNNINGFEQFFKKTEYTAACGGGTVFLAASSQNLLSRMKDSCERQSLSILDWERGAKAKEYDSSQLMLFVKSRRGNAGNIPCRRREKR
ncbi:MAG: hypothetical protein HC887_09510 [Desulfobacteraceae bacterium]|nr:hypothetical protein [Desulfobacteraceae bacterium]